MIGRAFQAEEVPDAIECLLATYLEYREVDEHFVDCVQRLGLTPFKEGVYLKHPAVEVPA